MRAAFHNRFRRSPATDGPPASTLRLPITNAYQSQRPSPITPLDILTEALYQHLSLCRQLCSDSPVATSDNQYS